MNYPAPFRYPKSRKVRTCNPAPRPYAEYKPLLRREFRRKCVYCCLPDFLRRGLEFEIDHYKPQTKYLNSSDADNYQNLFYSCRPCNSHKKAFFPKNDNITMGEFIPNPCDHVMTDHLKFVGSRIEPQSPAGKFTEERLLLNEDAIVEFREFVIRAINIATATIIDAQKKLKGIEKKLLKGKIDNEKFESEKLKLVTTQKEIHKHLFKLTR